MRVVDTRGQQCPLPIIEVKRTLKVTGKGDTFQVITDNLTTLSNLSRFLKGNKIEFNSEESKGIWILTISK